MITITDAQWYALINSFLWPMFRILGMVNTDPLFGGRVIPRRVKILYGAMIALALAPSLPPMPDVAPLSPEGLLIALQQILIGMSIGFTLRITFLAIEMAGHIIGLQMGLGFALLFDPDHAGQVPLMAQFTGMFAVLVFLSLNGHLMMMHALSESFRLIPITAAPIHAAGFTTLVSWGGQIFSIGLLLSLPIIAALLITNLAIGILTKAAPQLNLFGIGFPITLSIGFLVYYLSLPYFIPVLERSYTNTWVYISKVLVGFK